MTELHIWSTAVSDLSPLKGMPLVTLLCHNSQVTDFSLLKDMPLKRFEFNFKPERDTKLLRSISTLEAINEKPAAEFWKQVEQDKERK